jgi:hypothetical protein
MVTEIQEHPLKAGGSLTISRNGNHQYWVDDGTKVPSVTGLVGHVDSGGLSAGIGYAVKQIKLHGGDTSAPDRLSKAALNEGNRLHDAIDAYIQHGEIAEDNPLFIAWLQEIGPHHEWLASERFVYNKWHAFGGTIDALSLDDQGRVTIFDWKTVDPGEAPDKARGIRGSGWALYGSSLRKAKDSAQLAAYAYTLADMGSMYVPTEGRIAYILRDASKIVVEEVDLAWGWKLFEASKTIYDLRKDGR